eukprot:12897705-Prorocentrum_lima.AAC.1
MRQLHQLLDRDSQLHLFRQALRDLIQETATLLVDTPGDPQAEATQEAASSCTLSEQTTYL